jgi:hypothetical protein
MTFFFAYSVVGFWTATEDIRFPWSALEPRDDPLAQVLWIGASVFGFLVLMMVSPHSRRNLGSAKEWLLMLGALGTYTLIVTPLIFFVMIWVLGGVDGLLGPQPYSPHIVIALLALYLLLSLLFAGFLYFTEAIEDHSEEIQFRPFYREDN